MAVVTYCRDHERVRIRTARRNTRCWAWAEKCSAPGDADYTECSRVIAAGERYAESTIYPGHDSGYADGGPFSTRHCMSCAHRWVNLKRAMTELEGAEES